MLGAGSPNITLLDSSNPAGGGIVLTYQGTATRSGWTVTWTGFVMLESRVASYRLHVLFVDTRSQNDPFWCPWNPATQSQYPRTVQYVVSCDLSLPYGKGT